MYTQYDPDTINQINKESSMEQYDEYRDTYPADESQYEARQDAWADRNLW